MLQEHIGFALRPNNAIVVTSEDRSCFVLLGLHAGYISKPTSSDQDAVDNGQTPLLHGGSYHTHPAKPKYREGPMRCMVSATHGPSIP